MPSSGHLNTTLWPCIRLVGEEGSKGKCPVYQKKQVISYLHFLLLARPDLHVAQGLFTSKSGVMFLFGIGGVGVRNFSVRWNSKELYKLMYAFVYRLYDPGDFVDSSYVKIVPDLKKNIVTYTVQITEVNGVKVDITGLLPIYASSPFGTRTHILSNPDSNVTVDGKPLTVLKDQLCLVGTQFDEYSILKWVHNQEKVPGVVEAVHHELVKIHGDYRESRQKHRIGLRQTGMPFTSILTAGHMLEVVFDILEGSSFLLSVSCVLTSLQCCGICALSAGFSIVTSAKETCCISRILRLMLRRMFGLVEQRRRVGQRDSPSASSSFFLARGE